MPAAIPDHKPDQIILLLSDETYSLRKGKRSKHINPGPCIRLKAQLLQAVKLEEVAQFGFANDMHRIQCFRCGFAQLLATFREVL
jgi:hypothetical protein